MGFRNFIAQTSIFHLGKQLWEDVIEYKEEYIHVIRQRERYRIPFMHQSPQFHQRTMLIEHLKKVSINKRLTHCCLHLAVYILDIFMDNHSIAEDKVLMVANVCLWIAAKFEEIMSNIPKVGDLNATVNNQYKVEDYKTLETLILKFFHWFIMFPTAPHYTHYYMQGMLNMNDLQQHSDVKALIFDLHAQITQFLDKVIDDVHFMQYYPPSVLAAAIIAASRFQLGLASWTEELTSFTKWNFFEIQEPMNALLMSQKLRCPKCLSL